MELNLKRPLVFFDLETTGTDILNDRIVEISLVKVHPDGLTEEYSSRVNPGRHIPEESSAVHKIYDEDVKEAPLFSEIAHMVENFFQNSDIAGFNSNKFDVPMLLEEFSRAGVAFNVKERHLIDIQNIFHKKEPRTLVAAYRYYCGREYDNPHSALEDTKATLEVLKAQLDKYPDLANDVEELAKFSKIGNSLDLSGRIVENAKGEPVFNFGKHKGKSVIEVFSNEPSFYSWMMQGAFAKDTKDLITVLYSQRRK